MQTGIASPVDLYRLGQLQLQRIDLIAEIDLKKEQWIKKKKAFARFQRYLKEELPENADIKDKSLINIVNRYEAFRKETAIKIREFESKIDFSLFNQQLQTTLGSLKDEIGLLIDNMPISHYNELIKTQQKVIESQSDLKSKFKSNNGFLSSNLFSLDNINHSVNDIMQSLQVSSTKLSKWQHNLNLKWKEYQYAVNRYNTEIPTPYIIVHYQIELLNQLNKVLVSFLNELTIQIIHYQLETNSK